MVSEGMRTILWDLDRNAGDMPFKFDCLLLFSLFSFLYFLLLKFGSRTFFGVISFLSLYGLTVAGKKTKDFTNL